MFLLKLPAELKLMIAHHLESAKDMSALMRCCKSYTILEQLLYQRYTRSPYSSRFSIVPIWAAANRRPGTLIKWFRYYPDGANDARLLLYTMQRALNIADKKTVLRVLQACKNSVSVEECLGETFHGLSATGVRIALALGAHPHEVARQDLYTLFYCGSDTIAQMLLSYGLDPNTEAQTPDANYNDPGLPLLVLACQRQDAVVLEALLKAGADVRRCIPSHSPSNQQSLNMEERYAHDALRRWLLRNAAVFAPNLSCLHFLLRNGHIRPSADRIDEEMLDYLIHDPEADLNRAYFNLRPGETGPSESRLASLAMLLDHGLDPNSLNTTYRGWYTQPGDSLSLLAYAATEGHVAALRLLLDKGASIDCDPLGHGTPLMHALRVAQLHLRPQHRANLLAAVRHLIEAGTDLAPGDGHAATVIHAILAFESPAMLRDLFRAMRAGHRAPRYAHLSTPAYIRTLLNRGFHAGTSTALIQAVEGGRPATVQLLLAHGASAHRRDRRGRTPIMAAAQRLCHWQTVADAAQPPCPETLIAQRLFQLAGLVTADCRRTAAATVCRDLLAHGADPYLRDQTGRNAFDHAGPQRDAFAHQVRMERGEANRRRRQVMRTGSRGSRTRDHGPVLNVQEDQGKDDCGKGKRARGRLSWKAVLGKYYKKRAESEG